MDKTELAQLFNKTIALGDLGTQLFWFNGKVDKDGKTDPITSTVGKVGDIYKNITTKDLFKCTAVSGSTYTWTAYTRKFEYALPVVNGAEFGGDTESFDAPESDLPYVPKVSGRSSINDVTYTSNLTPARYARWKEIVDTTIDNTYLEVFADGSAMMVMGTGGVPRIMSGDVRTIEQTIIPKKEEFIADVFHLTDDDVKNISTMLKDAYGDLTTVTVGNALPFDDSTIPTGRISIVDERINLSDGE